MSEHLEKIHSWFVEHHKKLAFAESCTGGALAAEITARPGASDYFLGSFVVYSNGMKEEILGVSAKTLNTHGPVSKEVVSEMLAGVFKKTSADIAIAVSGVAGPTGGTEKTPVGTIWAAIGRRGQESILETFRLTGSRHTIIQATVHLLLETLSKKVCHLK